MNFFTRLFISKRDLKYQKDMEKYESDLKEWKNKLEKRMEKDQDWLFPILLGVALWGIGFIVPLLKTEIDSNLRYFWLISIILFILSILSSLFHLYLNIRWTSKLLEEKTESTCGINNLRFLTDLSFWSLVIGIILSIIFYSYVWLK